MRERELFLKDAERLFLENGIKLFHFVSIDSTNKKAQEYAREGGRSPALFWADAQTAGSGRLGRSFFSPDKTGLYMTLLAEMTGEERGFSLLTSLAAVCAREAIETVLGIDVKIKWVNDLYLNGKKIAGILAQSFFAGDRRFVALGVGINISTRDFPDELSDKAGALLVCGGEDTDEVKRDIAIAFCQNMRAALCADEHSGYMARYRQHSCVIGRRIRFVQNGDEYVGYAEGITDDGALKVVLDSGDTMILSSGEISVFVDR